ncbi:hypothetical protein FGD77_20460 [Roseovarius sp. M141]|nr:hypothetical protein [Roseovarius sp. M141]
MRRQRTQASPALCYFEVDGNMLIQGRCVQVAQLQTDACWNDAPGANHVHNPLGKLIRVGGCRVNRRARVCAWK